MFKCEKCGMCCRNLKMSSLYSDLDRGDGVCKFLDGNLCSIYSNRPLKCRVDESYEVFFKQTMSLEEYYLYNTKMCELLRKKEN